jgi:hypothetical protein
VRRAVLDIGPAVAAVHVRQRSVGPPGVECENALLSFVLARVPRRNVHKINREDVAIRISEG